MNLSKFSEMFDKKKTFRPKKKFQPGTMKYSLHKQAQASLNSGINLRQVVKLPKVSIRGRISTDQFCGSGSGFWASRIRIQVRMSQVRIRN
jgi:hypothetical protein